MRLILTLGIFAAIAVTALTYRARRVAGPKARRVSMTGKTVIVTGASPGSLGFETARELASWGARVVITTRSNVETVAEAIRRALPVDARTNVLAHVLDLSDAASVEAFATWARETLGDSLDVLVNNAGIHLDLLSQWKSPRLTPDGFEIQWRTNFLGTFHLTTRLLPMLQNAGRASGDARIVNVVSMLHRKGNNAGLFTGATPYDSWVAYGLSKLALVHATRAWNEAHQADGVRAVCLHPGSVYTKVADKGLEGNGALQLARKLLSPFERFFLKTPFEGAQTQVHCATSPTLRGGAYYRECVPAKASPEADDEAVTARLVSETQRWIAQSRTASA